MRVAINMTSTESSSASFCVSPSGRRYKCELIKREAMGMEIFDKKNGAFQNMCSEENNVLAMGVEADV
ncbi:unnamed protein product [Clavelina lepadiformis]|uniref:Uncharacterized protein n=1 Tax=Clavelina lepadiformis TaxID=159417 RepID=A0ABP0GUN9_CLALP